MSENNREVTITLVSAAAVVLASIIQVGQPVVEKLVNSNTSKPEPTKDIAVNTSNKKSENKPSDTLNLGQLDFDQDGTKVQVVRSTSRITADKFHDTTWKIECPNCDSHIQEHFIRLKSSGSLGYNNDKPENFNFDDTDSWRVEGNTLIISNSNGYSIEKYTFANPNDIKASGTLSSVSGAVYIQRIE